MLCLNETISPMTRPTSAAGTARAGGRSKYHARAAETISVPSVMKPRITTSSIVIARPAAGGAYDGAPYIAFNWSTDGVGVDQVC